MPRYNFKCGECDAEGSKLMPIAKRNDPMECSSCGGLMSRTLGMPKAVSGVQAPNDVPPQFKNLLDNIEKEAGPKRD